MIKGISDAGFRRLAQVLNDGSFEDSTGVVDLETALGDLIQWAVGNRGSKNGNPYLIPEVRQALKTLAESKGIEDWRDAADDFRL